MAETLRFTDQAGVCTSSKCQLALGTKAESARSRHTHMVCKMLPMAEKMVCNSPAIAETMLFRHEATAAHRNVKMHTSRAHSK